MSWYRFNVILYVKGDEVVNTNLMPNSREDEDTRISTSVINMEDVFRYFKSTETHNGIEIQGTAVVLTNDDCIFLCIPEKEFTVLFQQAKGIEIVNCVK